MEKTTRITLRVKADTAKRLRRIQKALRGGRMYNGLASVDAAINHLCDIAEKIKATENEHES